MNNNRRRALERRHRRRQERRRTATPAAGPAAAADPLLTPPPAGSTCAVCAVRPASTRAEIGGPDRPSLFFPVCRPCAAEAPAVLRRLGFDRYRRLVEKHLLDAEGDGRATA